MYELCEYISCLLESLSSPAFCRARYLRCTMRSLRCGSLQSWPFRSPRFLLPPLPSQSAHLYGSDYPSIRFSLSLSHCIPGCVRLPSRLAGRTSDTGIPVHAIIMHKYDIEEEFSKRTFSYTTLPCSNAPLIFVPSLCGPARTNRGLPRPVRRGPASNELGSRRVDTLIPLWSE